MALESVCSVAAEFAPDLPGLVYRDRGAVEPLAQTAEQSGRNDTEYEIHVSMREQRCTVPASMVVWRFGNSATSTNK